MLSLRRPDIDKLVRKRDVKGLVSALRYHDTLIDNDGGLCDIGVPVRRDAALALASAPAVAGDDSIWAALVTGLGDRSVDVRRAAAIALGARSSAPALPALAQAALTWAEPHLEPARLAALDAVVKLVE